MNHREWSYHIRFRKRAPGSALLVLLTLGTPVLVQPAAATAPVQQEVSPVSSAEDPALVPERSFELETDEGTWISLDVAPNGKSMVLDLLGDLYTLPIEGGDATRIRGGLAFDSQPTFSPDGASIAFLSDADGSENLWISRANGDDPRPLSHDRDRDFVTPRWSPDGKQVLVSRGLGGRNVHEIWAYDVDGGEPKKLLASGARRENYLVGQLTNDQRTLYYSQRQGAFSWDPQPPIWYLFRRDLAKEESEAVAERPGSAFTPRLSPDGRYLVYGTRVDTQTGLRLRDLTTGQERWLKYPVQRDDQEALASRDVLPGYAFLPDGSALVLSYGGKIWRLDVATGAATPVPFRAKISLDIGPHLTSRIRVEDGPVRAHLISNPQLSPDGQQVIFSALGHLYLMDRWGTAPRRITSGETFEFQPTWSADGNYVAYVTWSPEGGDVFKLRMDSKSAPERLSSISGFYSEPAISPDGAHIAALFASTQERQNSLDGLSRPRSEDLVWLPQEGGKPQRITEASGARWPHFVGDPHRVYVTSAYGVQSVALDGSNEKTHLKVLGKGLVGGAPRGPVENMRLSPDGRYALALANQQLYLVPMPAAQPKGEAGSAAVEPDGPTLDVAEPSTGIRRLSHFGADDFAWGAGGKSIIWSLGATLFRQSLATLDQPPQSYDVVLEAPRDQPRGVLVLRGAKVVTMRGQEIIEDGDIVIGDNRIVGVGARGKVPIPPRAKVYELAGKTIVPGFIDVHAHWHELMTGPVDRQTWPLWISLAYGVTASRDPQSRTLDLFLYKDLVDVGEIVGPRLFTTGPGIFSNTPISSYEEALEVATRYRDFYRTNLIKAYTTGDRKIRQWIVAASKELGLLPTTEGAMDAKLDLTHAIDGFSGNEHALPIVPLYQDVIQLLARTGIFYTPTLVLSYGGPLGENYFFESSDLMKDAKMLRFVPHDQLESKALRRSWFHPREHIFPQLAAAAAQIAAAGGKVCIGGHGEMQGIQVHWEMWALSSGGMPPLEVLRAATLNGAEAMGLSDDLGSIEPGKLADLVILDRDPLEDIENTTAISLVMKNGRLYDGDTLQEVWPRQRELPTPWWWQQNPHPLPNPQRESPHPGGVGVPFPILTDSDFHSNQR